MVDQLCCVTVPGSLFSLSTCLMVGAHYRTGTSSSCAAFRRRSLNSLSGSVTVSPRSKSDVSRNCFMQRLQMISNPIPVTELFLRCQQYMYFCCVFLHRLLLLLLLGSSHEWTFWWLREFWCWCREAMFGRTPRTYLRLALKSQLLFIIWSDLNHVENLRYDLTKSWKIKGYMILSHQNWTTINDSKH